MLKERRKDVMDIYLDVRIRRDDFGRIMDGADGQSWS